MVEKTLHDLNHAHEQAHHASEIQFSETEDHHCELCDLVLPTASEPNQEQFTARINPTIAQTTIKQEQTCWTNSPKYTFSLRGPPIYS